MNSSQYTYTERVIVELLVAALARTEFGKYYPDADVVIRWRKGKVLPVVEINRKVELNKPMPEG